MNEYHPLFFIEFGGLARVEDKKNKIESDGWSVDCCPLKNENIISTGNLTEILSVDFTGAAQPSIHNIRIYLQ